MAREVEGKRLVRQYLCDIGVSALLVEDLDVTLGLLEGLLYLLELPLEL